MSKPDHGPPRRGAGHLPAPARGQPIDHWLALQQRRLQRVDRRIVPFHAQRHRELHRPLLFSDQVSALSLLRGSAGLLILGIAIRLLMGVMLRAALDSVLAVGVLHQIFDASTNNGSLVDSLLDGADAGNMTQFAVAILTVLIAAWLLWRRPGAFAKRQIPLPDTPREVG